MRYLFALAIGVLLIAGGLQLRHEKAVAAEQEVQKMMREHYFYFIEGACFQNYSVRVGDKCFDNQADANLYGNK